MKVMDGSDAMVAAGPRRPRFARRLRGRRRQPPADSARLPHPARIIATLSAAFIIQSIDISYGRGLQIKPPPGFADFTNVILLGVPVLLGDPDPGLHRGCRHRAGFAHGLRAARVTAIGQNQRAGTARPAIPVERIRFLTYAPVRHASAALDRARCSPAIFPRRQCRLSATSTSSPRSPSVVIGGTSVRRRQGETCPASGARRCFLVAAAHHAQHVRRQRRHPPGG